MGRVNICKQNAIFREPILSGPSQVSYFYETHTAAAFNFVHEDSNVIYVWS